MFVDRMCCAASLRTVAGRLRASSPAIIIGRSPTTALDAPRGPSMFVERTCGAVRRRAARRGITRTVGRPQHGLATSGGSSMRAAFDTFAGDAACRTFACELPRDPHRPQSDHGARCPTGATNVLRSHLRRGITRTVDRRSFVRGARATSSSCRSFRRRRAVPDRKSAIEAATWAPPRGGVLVNAIECNVVRTADSV